MSKDCIHDLHVSMHVLFMVTSKNYLYFVLLFYFCVNVNYILVYKTTYDNVNGLAQSQASGISAVASAYSWVIPSAVTLSLILAW